MNAKFSKKFIKQYNKAPNSVRRLFDEKLRIFLLDKFDLRLNNHLLKSKLEGLRSINVGGDWRALFEELQNGDVIFKAIGTHNQLYK
jgi:mRNA-degrading endonuclease YafQ of YafQ-DinJ toxin-antitoxin module